MVNTDLQRLIYTISNGNKPNNSDVVALNGIIDYVNSEKERDINNYELFAKLFINVFKNDIIKSKGNYQMSLDVVKMILKTKIGVSYESFKDEINQIWLENEIENKNFDINKLDYPKWDIELTKNKLNNVINNLIEDYG